MTPHLAKKSSPVKPGMLALLLALVLTLLALPASAALDQAMPSKAPPKEIPHAPAPANQGPIDPRLLEDRTAFAARLDLDRFRRLAIQHDAQVKVIDSWARQSLSKIAHRSSLDGQDPVFTVMDMMLRPQYWMDRNFIYIQAVPIRQQLSDLVPEGDRARLLREGTVSPNFMRSEKVQQFLEERAARDQRLAAAIDTVMTGYFTFDELEQSFAVAPPADATLPWNTMRDLIPNYSPALRQQLAALDVPADAPKIKGYTQAQADKFFLDVSALYSAWQEGDAAKTNAQLAALTTELPQLHPDTYPSATKRDVEIIYNRSFNGTIAGGFFYLVAMVLMLLSISGAVKKAYGWGLAFFILGLLLHMVAMSVRWYLAGRIPIQNMFESIMGSALLGCVVGLALELWKRNGFFAMAMSAVGLMACTACLVVPFVIGKSMGESIAPTSGILMTYWLYIHVNVVIFSYALIASSFVLGTIYLVTKLCHWISPIEVLQTAPAGAGQWSSGGASQLETGRRNFLESIDAANVIVMRLSFLFLGTGIVLGAVWADVSWGRPWGWDPKETFALVTWLVYLILVHVRFAAPSTKGTATAALSVAGFAVMMFNWIGVNFFLVGLHSYA